MGVRPSEPRAVDLTLRCVGSPQRACGKPEGWAGPQSLGSVGLGQPRESAPPASSPVPCGGPQTEDAQARDDAEVLQAAESTAQAAKASVKYVSPELAAVGPSKGHYRRGRGGGGGGGSGDRHRLPTRFKAKGHTYLKLQVVLRLEFKVRPVGGRQKETRESLVSSDPHTLHGSVRGSD